MQGISSSKVVKTRRALHTAVLIGKSSVPKTHRVVLARARAGNVWGCEKVLAAISGLPYLPTAVLTHPTYDAYS